MKCNIVILGLITILFPTYSTEATTKQCNVQSVVDPANELTDQVKSYGARELRALRDVSIMGAPFKVILDVCGAQ